MTDQLTDSLTDYINFTDLTDDRPTLRRALRGGGPFLDLSLVC